MTATVTIDDALFAEVAALLQTDDPTQVICRALEAITPRQGAAPVRKPFDFGRTLAAAEALGDPSDEEFAAFEREMNRPLPPAWTE